MTNINTDQRQKLWEEILVIIPSAVSPEEQESAVAFSSRCFSETPDRTVLTLPFQQLGRLLLDHYRFFAHDMPPDHQLHNGISGGIPGGLPGIHVQVHNPPPEGCYTACSPDTSTATSFETTAVRIHTIDGPFIFESLRNYFRRSGIRVHSAIHPVIGVERVDGRISRLRPPSDELPNELYVYFSIEKIVNAERRERIQHEIYAVLKSLFLGVEDFGKMLRMTTEVVERAENEQTCVSIGGEPSCAFINWLKADNFIYMGMIRYSPDEAGDLAPQAESALGVFREPVLLPEVFPGLLDEVRVRLLPEASDNRVIDVDYCGNTTAIYHLEPVDYVAVRERADESALGSVTFILGRFAVGAMHQKSADVPMLREKLEWLLTASGARKDSFYYREIRKIFGILPKRELFYADTESLKVFIDSVIFMTSDEEVIVSGRTGVAGRYHVLYLAFSRGNFTHQVEQRIVTAISASIAPVQFNTHTESGTIEMLLFYLDGRSVRQPINYEQVRLIVSDILTTWDDRVIKYLTMNLGEHEGFSVYHRHHRWFSGLYREVTRPQEAPEDIKRLERPGDDVQTAVAPITETRVALKLYTQRPLTLMEILPVLANLGFTIVDEVRIPLDGDGGGRFIYRFDIEDTPERLQRLIAGEQRIEEAIAAIFNVEAVDDSLNRLILAADLDWRQTALIRAFRNHFLQLCQSYNVETVNGVLNANSRVAATLIAWFNRQFDPSLPQDRVAAVVEAERQVSAALDDVKSLTEDEVLRGIFNLMQAVVRTNFFAKPRKPVISIKVLCGRVEKMPSPRPMAEIYVHSPLLEGVHLRGGKVARGGIRWSDRPDDFRTEVLGLMKTQMVKNSIIVPVGSKGGFVLKGKLPPKPEMGEYLKARYREYISGLLDITDNIVNGQVAHPEGMVINDGPDPYLVLAADKGTAHLSDEANAVSIQHGLWLGDAFASGGSRGYDHKKVGITARGAWECAQRHFHEAGIDLQGQGVTVAGIGDMAGDVFGNGMLRSNRIKLLAAFNHAHIFLDPDPDARASFEERKRLFYMPGSTWRDYKTGLISKGGGVFDRSAKAIELTQEVRSILGVRETALSGEELTRRILAMDVEMLYNGGIGTYVKAHTESHADVGDRANDRVRVNGADVRAKIIVEGGNLGMTQKGRLEYWAGGGRCNTDAVDNSAGVDMSDHEVNIKILLEILVSRNLLSAEERDPLMAEMTEEVASLVLIDNYLQSQAISLDSMRSVKRHEEILEIIRTMSRSGILLPEDEAIPPFDELKQIAKKGRGMPRPLLAVLLGYQKMWAYHRILESSLPDSPTAKLFLAEYFPTILRERYRAHFHEHPLRREIAATVMVNRLINHAGITFLVRMEKTSGKKWADILDAWLAVEKATGAEELRRKIYILDGVVPADTQYELLCAVEDKLEAAAARILKGHGGMVMPEELATVRDRLRALTVLH